MCKLSFALSDVTQPIQNMRFVSIIKYVQSCLIYTRIFHITGSQFLQYKLLTINYYR